MEFTVTIEKKENWLQPRELIYIKEENPQFEELQEPIFRMIGSPEKRKTSWMDYMKDRKFSISKLLGFDRKGSVPPKIERKSSQPTIERVNSFSSLKDVRRGSYTEKSFKFLLDNNREALKKKNLTNDAPKRDRGKSIKRKSQVIAESKIKELFKDEEVEKKEEKFSNINEKLYFLIKEKRVEDFKKEIESSTFEKDWMHPGENETLLHKATKMNLISVVEILINLNVNIDLEDKMKRTPLLIASSLGYKDIAIILIAKGANIHRKDGYGYYPLFICLKHHQFHMIQDLILFGADVNMKRDNGSTPLHESILNGDSEMLDQILMIKGAKLNIKETNGKSPLLSGCEAAPADVFLKFLKVKGVDFTVCDEMGRNIFHFLAIFKRNDILKELLVSQDCTVYKDLLIQKERRKQRTPLHLAVESKSYQLVKSYITLYMTSKIDILIQDINKHTPYDLAYAIIEKEYMEKEKEENPFEQLNQESLLIEDLLNNMKSKKK